MSQQHIFDFEQARQQCDTGMYRALDHAERVDDEWPEIAYSFLIRFARTHATFEGWQCTDEAKRLGYASPTTDRAWGPLYRRALVENVIVQDGAGRNPYRHASICVRYRSLVYRGDAA